MEPIGGNPVHGDLPGFVSSLFCDRLLAVDRLRLRGVFCLRVSSFAGSTWKPAGTPPCWVSDSQQKTPFAGVCVVLSCEESLLAESAAPKPATYEFQSGGVISMLEGLQAILSDFSHVGICYSKSAAGVVSFCPFSIFWKLVLKGGTL